MGDNTNIEWCDKTFNPWEGCTKVGPGCDHCYAEARNNRFQGGNWGPGAPRRRTSEDNWKKPLKWNREAAEKGVRYRVFCASLADVFDNEVPVEWRTDLFELIRKTPNLDWLLLTKRIGNVNNAIGESKRRVNVYQQSEELFYWLKDWHNGMPPENVWIGATIVNQAEADRDIPKLLKAPAAVRFLSMEPLLGHVDLFNLRWIPDSKRTLNAFSGMDNTKGFSHYDHGVDWVIVGGESGSGARPMNPDWARSLRDQCNETGVSFLFKQWGEWVPAHEKDDGKLEISGHYPLIPKEWELFVDGQYMAKVGKKSAGRELDGRTWDEYPK